jgi:hypothetical protein
MRFLVEWIGDRTRYPAKSEEAAKLLLSQAEEVKAALKAGTLKDWAAYVSGGSGYMIAEVANEMELYAMLRKWRPYIQFEVSEPTMTVDQTLEATKKALAAVKK